MTKESKIVADWVTKVRSLEEGCGIDGVGNILQHVNALRNKNARLEKELNEFVEISGCANSGRAKIHFKTLMRDEELKHNSTLESKVFPKVSSTWLDGVVGKKGINAEAPISPRRAELEHKALMPLFILLEEKCKKLENGKEILAEFEYDYLTLGRQQFSNKLYKFIKEIIEVDDEAENGEILLVEAIPLCRNYYPEQLLQDFISLGEELGTVSAQTFNSLDTASAAGDDTAKIAAQKIMHLSLHRASGGQGSPTFQEENTYARLLSTTDNCPWGEEWVVQDNTRLEDLVNYVNLEGATL